MKGAEVADAMKEKLIAEVKEINHCGMAPALAIVRLGARPDDIAYERGVKKRFGEIGIEVQVFDYPVNTKQEEFLSEMDRINRDDKIHGILLFRPLPDHISEDAVKRAILAEKDVDCQNPENIAKVFAGDKSGFAPCTPEAVIEMLDHYKIELKGKNIVVVGRSMVVGKPLSMLLLDRHATVTICHTRTRELEMICRNAEILVAAAGKAGVIRGLHVGDGAVVLDVGINFNESGKICGDVHFDSAVKKARYITPVPGGVGAVTTLVLAAHVIRAAKRKCGLRDSASLSSSD